MKSQHPTLRERLHNSTVIMQEEEDNILQLVQDYILEEVIEGDEEISAGHWTIQDDGDPLAICRNELRQEMRVTVAGLLK